MSNPGTISTPFMLKGSRGSLYCIYHQPASKGDREVILVAPPFAEEMNRCRSMLTMTSREIAKWGTGVLVVDLFGTGDSEGEYGDAGWKQWVDDLGAAHQWIAEQGKRCQTVWGIRTGALLLADLVNQGKQDLERMLLWQPVLSGKTYLTQFLRIRIAAELQQKNGIKNTRELMDRLEAGESVEVSGYFISPAVAAGLENAEFAMLIGKRETANPLRIDWFDITPEGKQELPLAARKARERLAEAGSQVETHSVAGPPFWQLHERTVAEDLISATVEVLRG